MSFWEVVINFFLKITPYSLKEYVLLRNWLVRKKVRIEQKRRIDLEFTQKNKISKKCEKKFQKTIIEIERYQEAYEEIQNYKNNDVQKAKELESKKGALKSFQSEALRKIKDAIDTFDREIRKKKAIGLLIILIIVLGTFFSLRDNWILDYLY